MRKETRDLHVESVEQALTPLLAGDPVSVRDLAEFASSSRFHFHRVFKDVMGETPGELRRRLLLERAAWHLLNTALTVTEIAFDAEFGSLEGFIRAFQKAFGPSPSRFRRLSSDYRLPAANGLHFSPSVGALPLSLTPRGDSMDLTDRLLEHDLWLTRQMLEQAKNLTDAQLDVPLKSPSQAVGFEPEQNSLRDLLDRIVFTKEAWVASLENQEMPSIERSKTVAGMIMRFEIAAPTFVALLKRVREQGKWDGTFVDALCEPPETFTFGGMAAHVLTFGIFRRQLALEVMRKIGIEALSYGDPIEWERNLTHEG